MLNVLNTSNTFSTLNEIDDSTMDNVKSIGDTNLPIVEHSFTLNSKDSDFGNKIGNMDKQASASIDSFGSLSITSLVDKINNIESQIIDRKMCFFVMIGSRFLCKRRLVWGSSSMVMIRV